MMAFLQPNTPVFWHVWRAALTTQIQIRNSNSISSELNNNGLFLIIRLYVLRLTIIISANRMADTNNN